MRGECEKGERREASEDNEGQRGGVGERAVRERREKEGVKRRGKNGAGWRRGAEGMIPARIRGGCEERVGK